MAHDTKTVAAWLVRILGIEGGFTQDRNDPGNWTGGQVGAGRLVGTKWGVAANTYPHLDIAALTQDDAAGIYRRDFLAPLQVDRFADGVAFQLLDFAVNSGPGTALRKLQRAVGVADDGKIGPVTLAAVAACSESDLIMLVLAERIDFMTSLKNWPDAGKGWMRRIARNLRFGAEDS